MIDTDKEEPGLLVDITRLLLYSGAEQTGITGRMRRAVDLYNGTTTINTIYNNSWLSLLSDVNRTFPELSTVLDNLTWPSTTTLPIAPATTPTPFYPEIGLSSTTTSPKNLTYLFTDATTSTLNLTTISLSTDATTGPLTTSYPLLATNSTPNQENLWTGQKLGWCLQVMDLRTQVSSFTCSPSFSGPLAVVILVCTVCTALGWICGRMDRRKGASAAA